MGGEVSPPSLRTPLLAIHQHFPQHSIQFPVNAVIRNTQHKQPTCGDHLVSVSVVLRLVGVNFSVEFEYHPVWSQ